MLRLAQGLALGGEYGGAAIYVAEHSSGREARPEHELDPDDGDRRPAAGPGRHRHHPVSMSCRGLHELRLADPVHPVDRPRRAGARTSGCACRRRRCSRGSRPRASRRRRRGARASATRANRKLILLALFGATAGQAVVWYQGQFQALFFLGTNLGREVPGRLPDRRDGDRPRDAVLRRLRAPVRPDRPQTDHPRRLPDRRAHLLPDLQPHDPRSPTRRGAATPASRRASSSAPTAVDRRPTRDLAAHRPRLDPGRLRDDGLRPDRGVPRRVLPGPDPLHVAVDPVPHRQRLVRRLPAAHRGDACSRRPATSTPG